MNNRKQTFIIILIMIMLSCLAACSAKDSWSKIREFNADGDMHCALFLNENYGIVGGSQVIGRHMYTYDGGKTWTRAEYIPVQSRRSIDIINDKLSFSAGYDGIAFTEDGGKNWQKILDGSGQLLSFYDRNNGWAGDENMNKIFSTADGGKTWNEITLNPEIKKTVSINLISGNTGYLLDNTGSLYMTADNAKTWNKISISAKKQELIFDRQFSKVSFINANEGMIITRTAGKKEAWIILKTKDGGKSWDYSLIDEKNGILHISKDQKYITIIAVAAQNKVIVYKNGR